MKRFVIAARGCVREGCSCLHRAFRVASVSKFVSDQRTVEKPALSIAAIWLPDLEDCKQPVAWRLTALEREQL